MQKFWKWTIKSPRITLDGIGGCLVAFVTISSVYPPLRAFGANTWYCLFALFLWCFIAALQDREFFLKIPVHQMFSYFFIIYTILLPYLLGTNTLANRYVALLIYPVGAMICRYYYMRGKQRILLNITYITLLFSVITFFRTCEALLQNPNASRMIKSGGEYTGLVLRQGIGGYEFIYFACLAAPLFLAYALKKKTMTRWLGVIGWIMTVLLIVLSNYFTALVFLVVASALVLYFSLADSKKMGAVKAGTLILVAGVVLLVYGRQVLYGVSEIVLSISQGGRTADRLLSFEGSILNGAWEEFLNGRWPTIQVSIESWRNHPIFGVATIPETVSGRYLQNVGQHSHILDTFAIFGTVIGVVNLIMIFAPLIRLKVSSIYKWPVVITLAGILFFNNAVSSLAVAAYIMMPCVAEWTEKGKYKDI